MINKINDFAWILGPMTKNNNPSNKDYMETLSKWDTGFIADLWVCAQLPV